MHEVTLARRASAIICSLKCTGTAAEAESAARVVRLATVANNRLKKHGVWSK